MVGGDYVGALLMAVAALEGVHAVYVTHVLDDMLPKRRTGDDRDLADKFLKELGFSLCNKLSPYLFLEPADRPSDDLVAGVAAAVKYRNEVMHALRNSSGQYKIRLRNTSALTRAYRDAVRMFDTYWAALQKKLPPVAVTE